MADVKVSVALDMPRILNKVENDKFGLFLAKEWHRLISPYTPHKDGFLERLVTYKPFEITYVMPYSHYMYCGVPYVDPLYRAGGFTNDGGATWYSRKGVKKVPDAGKEFNYSKNPNEFATDHWDQKAAQAGQTDALISAANKYLRRMI